MAQVDDIHLTILGPDRLSLPAARFAPLSFLGPYRIVALPAAVPNAGATANPLQELSAPQRQGKARAAFVKVVYPDRAPSRRRLPTPVKV